MSTIAPAPERVQWFEGSALTERDLDDAVAYESRMLELHVRGVHDTWGIAHGLTVALSNNAREAVISPGYAYTCRGDALILPSLIRSAPPAATTPVTFDLVLAQPAVPEVGPCERPIACTGELATTGLRAALRWEPAGATTTGLPPLASGVRLGEEILLARFLRLTNGALVGPTMSQRRIARGFVRPHIAFGVTRPGELTWSQGAVDLYATVDTRDSGFSATPFYFATVGGAASWPAGVTGPLVSVGQASTASFRAHLVFGVKGSAPTLATLRAIASSAVVSWVGVEPVMGCPPTLSLLHFVALGLSANEVAGNWSSALATLSGISP